MQAIKPSELVELGTLISTIRIIEPETSVKEAEQQLKRLLELLGIAGLRETISEITNPAQALRNELSQIENIEYAIGMDLAVQFERFADQIQNELERECRKSRIFIPKLEANELERLIDSDKVIKEFDLGVWGWIPRVAKEDFQEAANCLAYDTYTGAAGLMLRATEACLGKFYRWYCQDEPFNKDRPSKKRKACDDASGIDAPSEPKEIKEREELVPESYVWGGMTNKLKARLLDQIDSDLYVELEILRKYFRNPTQHAARRYREGQALELWKNCKSVVNQMYNRIQLEGALLKICMPWPCDLDALFAYHLINDNAGPIGDWDFVDPEDKAPDHQGGYVVNCARGQFDRDPLKEPKSASWMLIKHFCLPEGGEFQKLLNHVNAAVVHRKNSKANPPKGFWVYVDWHMKNKVNDLPPQETIEKFLPLVQSYIGDKNPTDLPILKDSIVKLKSPLPLPEWL